MNINFSPDDFQPLKSFNLAWRWTQETHTVLPPEVLADIQPLADAKAATLQGAADHLHRQFVLLDDVTEQQIVGLRTAFTHAAWQDNTQVRDWLRSLSVRADAPILVFWRFFGCAVVTRWQIFCDCWSDFCYPVSDDVIVWPLSGEWGLEYRHSEDLGFAERLSLLPAT